MGDGRRKKKTVRELEDEAMPCPFCGMRPRVELLFGRSTEMFVTCRGRECVQSAVYNSAEAAIKAWNRRV